MVVRSRSWWQGYVIAVGSVLIALGLTLLFRPATEHFAFVFFYAALTVSAGYGGLGPGLLTTVLAVLLVDYYFIPPLYVISFDPIDLLPLGLFVLTALFVSSFQSQRRQAEQTLRDQREHYRITLSSIGDAVIATDTQGRITFMNAVAEGLTGWSQREAQDVDVRQVFRIVNEQTRQPVENPILKVLQSGATVGLANHTVLISKNGQDRPIDDSGAPIKNQNDEISGVILVFRDVTERKRDEAHMRWLASFPELNRQPVVELDVEGHVYYCNPTSIALFPDLEAMGLSHPFLNLTITEVAALQDQPGVARSREVYAAAIWFQQILFYLPESQRIRIYAIDISQRRQAEARMLRLQAVIEQFSKSLTPAEVVHVVIDQGLAVLGAVEGSVLLLSEDKTSLEMVDTAGYAQSILDAWHRIPVETPVMATDVIRRGEAIWKDSFEAYLAAYPFAARTPDLKPGGRAVLPLNINGETMGVIALTFDQPQPFPEDHKRFMLTLAHQCAQALERSRLYDAERHARAEAESAKQRLAILADASRAFAENNRDVKRLFNTITENLATLVGEACALRLLSGDGAWMETVSVFHPDPHVCSLMRELAADRRPTTQGLFKTVIESGQTIRVPGLTEELFHQSTPPHLHPHYNLVGARSTIFSPLRVGGQVIGILSLSRMTPDHPYTEEDEHLVQDITARAALAVETANLYEQAQFNAATLQQQVAERTVELQQALEQAQAADRAKTRMLSNVSHEIRTPLSSISGFTNLLLSRQLGADKQRQYLAAVKDESVRLTTLVNDFLDLQHIENGKSVFRFSPVDLTALIEKALEPLDGTEDPHRIRLLLSPTPPVQADPERIRQVLVNLVSNALKFSEGEIEVELHQDTTMIYVSVRDQGMGILPEELERIFEVFHRGEIAERERVRGTGLGLALCKEILAAHGGHIWAESAGEGQGATFHFTLPIA